MAVKLNRTSFEYAKELATQGKVVVDERDAWSEDQPSTQEENEFIDAHGYAETRSGTWESTTSKTKVPRRDTSFLMAISTKSTAAQSSPPRVGQDNTNILILSMRPRTYMA
jgi:hypothetical protein